MKLNILKTDGTETGRTVELPESVFAIEPRDTLVYEDVRAYLAHQRQGTAKTKGRTEVRGGGKKAFRQKGTGGARRGTLRSPLLKGGGTVFGPRPRAYTIRLTKKMKELARKSAFTYKAKDNAVVVVEDFSFEAPKTSSLLTVLKNLKLEGKKVLLLTGTTDTILYKSGRNIPGVSVLEAYKPSTYEVLHADFVLLTESALNVLTSVLDKSEEAAA
ncbi:MAG: 50S ribosomal protein L4 [Candidatus Cyclonatronum sp.]|uniref:50S ribosomal protein L4 n=1 Tax=Cyclonatronum sp. TaxID=3024185 RepID=UPI0025C13FDA|nr:50S ribosomal protein L4 [Cyclonatronum sp.]MCC5934992.1 50S ribosomal protein L4 [Balneolales bacterium]MCH8487462.1 50S ribosomal protein L4 [Cyclonatronum sp.]